MPSTTPAAVRWAVHATDREVSAGEAGPVRVRVRQRDCTRPFLLLHGGAGPASVSGFADLLATRKHARVIVPTHPGFDGTERPDTVSTVGDLARVYAALLDDLDVWDVTVLGNSLGGWVAAELALLDSPRVSGAVLVDAVGLDVPGHPVTDVATFAPAELVARSFYDPGRFAPDPGAPGPSPELVAANMSALFTYGGATMSDPSLARRLNDLELPVHVVWGQADGIVDPAYGRAYADAIPGARFTLMPTAGHLPQVEEPEELLGLIWGRGDE